MSLCSADLIDVSHNTARCSRPPRALDDTEAAFVSCIRRHLQAPHLGEHVSRNVAAAAAVTAAVNGLPRRPVILMFNSSTPRDDAIPGV